MPRATVSTDTTHKDLTTCPGGYVELRQLPFGQMLTRRDKASRMIQEIDPKAKESDIARVQVDILNEWGRRYDFKHCIADHNLEDENGIKLDFSNALAIDILDPRIGQEIERYIDELNQADFDKEGFTSPSDSQETQGSLNGME